MMSRILTIGALIQIACLLRLRFRQAA